MDLTGLHRLSATEMARMIREGAVTSVEVVQGCLARVREVDGAVQAWAFLDPEHALDQARAADELRMSGQPVGALHGVPVGIKGHHRHRRHADRERLGAARRPHAVARTPRWCRCSARRARSSWARR